MIASMKALLAANLAVALLILGVVVAVLVLVAMGA